MKPICQKYNWGRSWAKLLKIKGLFPVHWHILFRIQYRLRDMLSKLYVGTQSSASEYEIHIGILRGAQTYCPAVCWVAHYILCAHLQDDPRAVDRRRATPAAQRGGGTLKHTDGASSVVWESGSVPKLKVSRQQVCVCLYTTVLPSL